MQVYLKSKPSNSKFQNDW